MKKENGVNLGVEIAKTGDNEMDALNEFEATEAELRSTELVDESRETVAKTETELAEEQEFEGEFKETKYAKGYSPKFEEDTEFKGFRGSKLVEFPRIEDDSVSLYECYLPTSDTDRDGKKYREFIHEHENMYELRMYQQIWRWSKDDFEKQDKVIFRRTIGYLLRSIATSKQYLFVPKTNQLFPIV